MNDDVVIHRYPDEQAVDDGILVQVGPRDRVTRSVWDFLVRHAPPGPKPPVLWPVDMGRWFGGQGTGAEPDTKAAALAIGILTAHGAAARRVYEQNIGGGIWKGWAVTDRHGLLVRFSPDAIERRILERDALAATVLLRRLRRGAAGPGPARGGEGRRPGGGRLARGPVPPVRRGDPGPAGARAGVRGLP